METSIALEIARFSCCRPKTKAAKCWHSQGEYKEWAVVHEGKGNYVDR